MRLPVLESIIDGGDYNLSFPTGVLFGDYYNKSLKNDFDIKNNPFNFISNWREIKLLNLRNDDEDDDSFRKVFGAYDIIQCYSLEGARSDIDALLNNLALELDYLSKQLNLFERDYDSPEFFKGLIIEVFEYLLEKQRELYDEYIKQILLDYIFAFYFEYRKELDIWKEESNRNKRLLKILFDGGNWYNSIYEILDCIKNLDIKKSSHSYMVKRELSYIVDSIQRLQTTNFYISHLLYTNCVFELKILCFNLSNEFVRVIFLGKDYDALTSDRLELSNYLYKIPKENRREVIQKMYDIWSLESYLGKVFFVKEEIKFNFDLRCFRKSRCFYNQVIEYLLDKIKIYEQGEEPIFEYTHDDSIKYIDFDSIINMRYEGEGKNLLEEINEITQKAINTAISEYLESDLKINLVNYSVEENNINEDRIKQQIDTAQEYLKFLNCEYKGKRFMSEGDYRRMLSWVEVLIRDGKCPEQAGILTLSHSKDWVKYTLYLIQKEVMNFKKNDEWVRLAWIIGGSEGEFSTIKTKFSTAPKVVRNRVGYDEVVSQLVKGGKIGGKI